MVYPFFFSYFICSDIWLSLTSTDPFALVSWIYFFFLSILSLASLIFSSSNAFLFCWRTFSFCYSSFWFSIYFFKFSLYSTNFCLLSAAFFLSAYFFCTSAYFALTSFWIVYALFFNSFAWFELDCILSLASFCFLSNSDLRFWIFYLKSCF